MFLTILILLFVIPIVILLLHNDNEDCEHKDYKTEVKLSVTDYYVVVEIEIIYTCRQCNHVKRVKKEVFCRYNEEFSKEKWIKYALKNNFSIDKM